MHTAVGNSPGVYSYMADLKSRSITKQRGIIERYLTIDAAPLMPTYFNTDDIISSHILRSEEELYSLGDPVSGRALQCNEPFMSCTFGMIEDCPLDGGGGVLTELCMGGIG